MRAQHTRVTLAERRRTGGPVTKGGQPMTTAIIGVGKIGSAIARHLTAGGEQVVLASGE